MVVQKRAEKCTKKHSAREKLFFSNQTYCVFLFFLFFLTFSLPSASLDLKVHILARKRDSRRHSTTSFRENVLVTEQVVKCYKFYHFAIG